MIHDSETSALALNLNIYFTESSNTNIPILATNLKKTKMSFGSTHF